MCVGGDVGGVDLMGSRVDIVSHFNVRNVVVFLFVNDIAVLLPIGSYIRFCVYYGGCLVVMIPAFSAFSWT